MPDNITLLRLPPYAPERNPIENVWDYLRGNHLSMRFWDSYEAIVDACCGAWNAFVANVPRVASVTTREWITVRTWIWGISPRQGRRSGIGARRRL